MRARDLGEAFKLIMDERGWSQSRLGRELGQTQSWVSLIVLGKGDTYVKKAAAFLDRVGWELVIRPKSDGEEPEGDPVKRRQFIAAAASATFIPPSTTTPFHDPEFVRSLTKRTTQTHVQIGGKSLATTLLGHAREVASASADGGRELNAAASDFMRWAAYVLRDTGRPDIAIKFANSAIRHGGRAADPDLQAMAYYALIHSTSFNGLKGTMSTGGKDGSQAVRLALKALKIAGIGDESRAYLTSTLAGGLANVPGHEKQAHAAIEQALSIDTIPAFWQSEIIGDAGNVYRDIRKPQKALATLEDAVRLNSQRSQRWSAEYTNDQIVLAFDMREPERAAHLMNGLSYIVPLVDSPMLNARMDEMLKSARRWETVTEVREARERLRSVRPHAEE